MDDQPSTASAETSLFGAIVLAAGASSRLGQPKQLVHFEGASLLRRAASAALAAVEGPVVVVLGSQAERMQPELAGLAVTPVLHAQWAEGMGTSVRVGVQALLRQAPEVAGLVLLLCDQPFVTAETLRALVQLHLRSRQPLVAAQYQEVLGVPAFFHRDYFPELLACEGPGGAKMLLATHRQHVAPFPFPEGRIDIDSPEDYRKLLAGERA